ncbi:MAG: hypothetical protein ACI3ZT_06735, partial [Candidatus Cryptobacteroides sp.]
RSENESRKKTTSFSSYSISSRFGKIPPGFCYFSQKLVEMAIITLIIAEDYNWVTIAGPD